MDSRHRDSAQLQIGLVSGIYGFFWPQGRWSRAFFRGIPRQLNVGIDYPVCMAKRSNL